jgi:hypothetical protein
MRICSLAAWLVCVGLALPAHAHADDGTSTQAVKARPLAGRPVLDLRVGASTNTGPHPQICLEGYPLASVSLEACGTGAGFLHQDDAPDMAHFRGRWTALRGARGATDAALLVGAGFAEIQSTADKPGFRFGEAVEPNQVEAAGPEASVSAKARFWMHERTYIVADVNAGAAYIPGAPTVIGEGGPVVPFGQVTVGLGF